MKVVQHDKVIEVIYNEQAKEEKDQLQLADEVTTEINSIYKQNPDTKFGIILNLQEPSVYFDASSLRAYKKYVAILNLPQTHKIAVLGKGSFADSVTELAFSIIKEHKANFFIERDKAIKWLGAE